MKTVAVYVGTHCVPCYNRCRYCLLSWDGRTIGAEYKRCEAYAKRFHDWIQANRPELGFMFYFGYSMEHPALLQAVDFLQGIGSVGGELLQFDGMKLRNKEELHELLSGLKEHGVRLLNLTFYGTEAYHDRFAARKGDFQLMMDTMAVANAVGLEVAVDIPLTHENASQIDPLLQQLKGESLKRLTLFIPHGEGRGATLQNIRFTEADEALLSDEARAHLNRSAFRPEREWLRENAFAVPEKRVLQLSLTRENVEQFENMPFDQAIAYLEGLDDAYHAAVPDMKTLASRYGDENSTAFYRERDLYLYYSRRYIEDNHLQITDINDERYCGCRRF